MSAIGHDCEVAVVGAGPFGLATAAHLRSANIATHVFGRPMSFWSEHMPQGMKLRSPWVASHIAHPEDEHTLDAYAAMRGFVPHEQMAIGEFIGYGRWFQERMVPGVDTRQVVSVERAPQGFRLHLDDGESIRAGRVVVAMGLAHQQFVPAPFAGLASELVSHTSDHVSFDKFRGRRVAVVGRGQSACETAVLLSEAGAEVELICRGPVLWLGSDQRDGRSNLAWQLRKLMMTRGAVGPFPLNWLAEAPGLVHLLPVALRHEFAVRSLRPKASGWLRPRFGGVQVSGDQAIRRARDVGGRVTIDCRDGAGTFDHVVLGTGYRIDIAKLGILAPALLAQVAVADGAPQLSYGMESSVVGLHFVGATAVHSFGPLMRFVWGAGYAARGVARAALTSRARVAASGATPQATGPAEPAFAPVRSSVTRS